MKNNTKTPLLWEDISKEIHRYIFDNPSFVTATIKYKATSSVFNHDDIKIRQVQIKNEFLWQIKNSSLSNNLPTDTASKLFSQSLQNDSFAEVHIVLQDQDIHYRIAKKGTILKSKSKNNLNRNVETNHDHQKDYPLTRKDFTKLLRILGISDENDNIKPSMRAKYKQINEFLRIIDTSLPELPGNPTNLSIIDVGCGKAYLSFAVKAYIEAVHNIEVKFFGIDIKENVISNCNRISDAMGWTDSMCFICQDIREYKPSSSVDIVLSLHACDTATDEALAFGAEHGAKLILSAPCCQHELQKVMKPRKSNHSITRNSILRERLADILTDAFRAQILRAVGYRTTVFEFIEQEVTTRNIMIKAVRVSRRGTGLALDEYFDLRDEWGCTPYLATRLSEKFTELVSH